MDINNNASSAPRAEPGYVLPVALRGTSTVQQRGPGRVLLRIPCCGEGSVQAAEEVEIRLLQRLSFHAFHCNETALMWTRACSDVCARESVPQAKLCLLAAALGQVAPLE